MNLNEFRASILGVLREGDEFANPGGGVTTIIGFDEERIKYERGSSVIYVRWTDLHKAYEKFNGKQVNSALLQAFSPTVFSSKARPAGHSCNCTFFYLIMQRIGKAGPIAGAGVRGNPFTVNLSA